jgi:5-formyltetrahydrofolate cyclo-ligase
MLAEYLAEHTTKMHRKRSLRQDLRRRLEVNKGDSSVVVREIVAYLAERPQMQTVAVYSALPGEVELRTLMEGEERTWVFPKVKGEELVFHQVKDMRKDLVVGAYGILEPKKKLPVVEASEIDLYLCPGLGFDHTGARIGRGRGFYDRILAKARPDAIKLGVCFGFQLVDKVDMEPHDIRMNRVIAG